MTTDVMTNLPERRKMRRMQKGPWQQVPGHVVMILLSFICIFPVYWMIATSLRAPNAIFETSLFPGSPTLSNYSEALTKTPMLRMLWNTIFVSAAVTVIQLMTGILAAYGFTRFQFRFSWLAYTLVALTWLVPLQVVMIPNYLFVASLGLLDSLAALILPHAAQALSVMLLVQAMRNFPNEVVEAARMDGAGHWQVLWGIIVPNLRGMLASLAILVFISTWNEYFWPLLLTRSAENTVVQIGIQMFITEEGTNWGPLMAASTMASLPILIFYVTLQRQVIQSFMKSGLR